MKIYEVWTSDDERRASNKGTCDSLESALEFAKTISEWYHSNSLYETIMKEFGTIKNLKENLHKCYYIKEKELITIDTFINNNLIMEKFTIYCTKEQTRKALELGAPIIKYPAFVGIDEEKERFACLNFEYYQIPTAEQMIGWLEEQGFYFRLNTTGTSVEIDFKCISEIINHSRKEATLAAIDAALEYLSNKIK